MNQLVENTNDGERFCETAPDIAAMDLFVVPTISFDLLYDFVRPSGSQGVGLDQRHDKSDGRMDRTPANRGIPVA